MNLGQYRQEFWTKMQRSDALCEEYSQMRCDIERLRAALAAVVLQARLALGESQNAEDE